MEVVNLLVVGLCTALAFYLHRILWLRPERIRRALREQGIDGPRPMFLFGNVWEMKRLNAVGSNEGGGGGLDGIRHDYSSKILPCFRRWSEIYGQTVMFSIGHVVSVYVSDPNLVKEICLNKSLDLGKPSFLEKNFHALLGQSVVSSSGQKWATQRKIIAREFFVDKVKAMVNIMVESALLLVDSWEAKFEHKGQALEIKLDMDLKGFAADVISKACFGNNCAKREAASSKIDSLVKVLSLRSYITQIPGLRYLPTKKNRVIWKLTREIKSIINNFVEERKEGGTKDKDFLQSVVENANETSNAEAFVVDSCKSICFAGLETVSSAAKWALLLLGYDPEVQRRVREEVMEVCGDRMPDMEMLKKMNWLTIVIQETLRLYPPTPVVTRQVHKAMKLGDLYLPEGTILWIPALEFHHDPELWGADANQFNPERFVRGVSGACKHPHLYMPFGIGPRTCLGQNFAMAELKAAITIILARYKVSPSPSYRHSIAHGLVLGAEHGVYVTLEKM